jgi:hypothetical protein
MSFRTSITKNLEGFRLEEFCFSVLMLSQRNIQTEGTHTCDPKILSLKRGLHIRIRNGGQGKERTALGNWRSCQHPTQSREGGPAQHRPLDRPNPAQGKKRN